MKRMVTAVVLLAAAGWVGWKVYVKLGAIGGAGANRGPATVAVEAAPVQRATVHDIARITGDLTARSEFVVAPKVAGRLVKLLVNIGDTVTNEQVIAELDDEEYKQQVAQAEAELEVAKASVEESRSTLEAAQREFDRVEALRAKKIASESELDEARSQYNTALARNKVAMSQVAQKEAALETAKVRQGYTRIKASWTGGGDTRMIGERFADTGAMLKANDPIVSVVDIDELTAVVHVEQRRYAKIAVGQAVEISCDEAYPGKLFAGQVVRVAPLVKQTSRQARVEIQVHNEQRLLRPGMFIEARIELARHEDATVVPEAAIVGREDSRGVFLVDGKKAKFVPVKVGLREGSLVEILAPPLAGLVITMGQHQLEDGTAIAVAKEQALSSRPVANGSAASQPGAPPQAALSTGGAAS
jgi:RND family efflux transporter MFP subunit